MKAGTFIEPRKIVLGDYPMPKLESENDAILKIIRSSVCGSDLWWFRGITQIDANSLTGHEALGIVEKTGKNVNNIHPGDFVIVPFTHGCGKCAACLAGFDGNCLNKGNFKNGGYQAEYLNFHNADWALVKIPGKPTDYSDDQLNDFLALADVMATGYHAAASAEVTPDDTVVVLGDGAVGLCGIIAAKLRGAKRIIAMSRHRDRQKLAIEFGATDIVPERGREAVQRVMSLTNHNGVDAILECVGTNQSIQTALAIGRPGAIVGRVGVPHNSDVDTSAMFWKNIGIRGGTASVTTYDREILLDAVLNGKIHPGRVFTKSFKLDQIQEAYEAMDRREAIKSLLLVDDINSN